MTAGARLRGLLDLMRPGNAVAAGVLTFTGAFVAGETAGHELAVVAAVIATGAATGAGNAVNDYFDRKIDRINRPDRPIPRGAVSPRGALAFSLGLFVAAIAAALTLPAAALFIAVVNLTALIVYTELFKGLPGVGNALVAYLTGSAFLFGGAAVGQPLNAAVIVLFVLAAMATLAREIVKDVEDIAGDREEGLRTLPIVAGERPALGLGVAVMVLAAAASVYPYIRGTFGLAYLVVVVPSDLLMVAAAVQSFSDPGAAQRRLKLGMLLATGAFVAGRAAVILGIG